jgi:hypothetical protein
MVPRGNGKTYDQQDLVLSSRVFSLRFDQSYGAIDMYSVANALLSYVNQRSLATQRLKSIRK